MNYYNNDDIKLCFTLLAGGGGGGGGGGCIVSYPQPLLLQFMQQQVARKFQEGRC